MITCAICESFVPRPGQNTPSCTGQACHGYAHGCTCDTCQQREADQRLRSIRAAEAARAQHQRPEPDTQADS